MGYCQIVQLLVMAWYGRADRGQLSNLSTHDGSLFPTSIGANPQLSVDGLTAQLATSLAERLKSL